MNHKFFVFLTLLIPIQAFTQALVDSFFMFSDVKITIDAPAVFNKKNETLVVLFALPNGNTTGQTMGKILQPGDDWHYDIQHIKAQTGFLRNSMNKNLVVVYLENNYRSWPLWKQKHQDYKLEIPRIIDSILKRIQGGKKILYLNGHSGGGSFIFGYLDAMYQIPRYVQRISFLDSNYGYDSSFTNKLKYWLHQNKKATLTIFAYNDSVALYNGKPVVSPKGGTWYKSHQMMRDLSEFSFQQTRNDSLIFYRSRKGQIALFMKTNPGQKIYHTQQVELNGFIHSILYRTPIENKGYAYFGTRAYTRYITN